MTVPANRVLFQAYTQSNGTQLWVSDGTTAGTSLVKAILPSSRGSSAPLGFAQLGTKVVFSATDGTTHGHELWITDGTSAGTSLLVDINPGSGQGFPTTNVASNFLYIPHFVPIAGKLFFEAENATGNVEPWITDGTAAGTSQLLDINVGAAGSYPTFVTPFGSKLLFSANEATATTPHGRELWITDGTTAGTSLVKDIAPGISGSLPQSITDLGTGLAVFSASDSSNIGRELWVTDGTSAGTSLLKNISPAAYTSSNPSHAYLLGATGKAVFAAGSTNTSPELWVTDGTSAGTTKVMSFSGGQNSYSLPGSSVGGAMRTLGSKVIFFGNDGTGSTLWVTDGTAAGTSKLSSTTMTQAAGPPSGPTSTGPTVSGFVPLGSKDLFWATSNFVTTPWITDGTAAGTSQLSSTALSGSQYGFAVLGSHAVFEATTAATSAELFITDGTSAGTYLLRDINPSGASTPQNFATLGNKVLFQANDGSHNKELWVTDGTFLGTSLAKDINTVYAVASSASSPAFLFAATLPCFAAGTHIDTDAGARPVESLRVGQVLRTTSGALRPIRWIGHRAIAPRRHPAPHDIQPIRIAPHAFARNQPHTALRLSPDHAIAADGVLIPIRYLVNGTTIAREDVAHITYFHIELADDTGAAIHDTILAEGLPVESFLDTGNRTAFAGEAMQLHPDFARTVWAENACAPLAVDGPHVEALRSWLLLRAETLGHARTADPAIAFSLDGAPIAAVRHGAWLHLTLPAGACMLRLASRSAIPAEITDSATDTRRLGIALAALALDGIAARLDDPILATGWHAAESALRWTTGDATINVAGHTSLRLALHAAPAYWRNAA